MTKPDHDQVKAILKEVQDRLDRKFASSRVELKVDTEAIRCDEEWLYVVVTPTKNGIRAYDYVRTLAEVEEELRASHRDKVLLVPAIED